HRCTQCLHRAMVAINESAHALLVRILARVSSAGDRPLAHAIEFRRMESPHERPRKGAVLGESLSTRLFGEQLGYRPVGSSPGIGVTQNTVESRPVVVIGGEPPVCGAP